MGLDFANYQVFAGNTNAKKFHNNLLSQFPELMVKNGFQSITQSEEADRIIVIGPPGPWVWIYDSYAEGINPANHYLKELAIALSGYGEVVAQYGLQGSRGREFSKKRFSEYPISRPRQREEPLNHANQDTPTDRRCQML